MSKTPREVISDGLIGGLFGVLTFVVVVLIASPFLNWMLGHGFTWYF